MYKIKRGFINNFSLFPIAKFRNSHEKLKNFESLKIFMNLKFKVGVLLLLLAVGLIVGIFVTTQVSVTIAYEESDKKAYSVDKDIVASYNSFGLDLLKELWEEDQGKNIVFSPLSVSLALTMLFNGAENTTKIAMAKVLHFENKSLERVNEESANLTASLENVDRKVQLHLANSVWLRKEFDPLVNESFKERLSKYYKTEMSSRDFADPATVNEINDWVSRKTNGKINKVLERIEPQIVMFLINAIYFKGEWKVKFDESKTRKGTFYLSNGDEVVVDMMETKGEFKFYFGDDFSVLRLPYGRDKISMYIFLPDVGSPLNSMMEELTWEKMEEVFNNLQGADEVRVEMPKFSFRYEKRMNQILSDLGMSIIFDEWEANFSKIAHLEPSYNLYVEFVDHKAFIEVNEEGTEAAAATTVGIGITSVPRTITFTVDHPFLFVIRDDRSGIILFAGVVEDPTKS